MASQSSAARSVPEPAGPSNDLQATGAGLRRVEFPTGMWGYERHAVDAYVARVGGFVDEAVTLRRPDGAVRDALARVGEETSAVLQRATEVAEDITARSQTQADDRLARAERKATAIKEAAEAQARELDAEIEHLWRERVRLLGEMERIAEELAALAKDADRRFPTPEGRAVVSEDPTVEHQGEATGRAWHLNRLPRAPCRSLPAPPTTCRAPAPACAGSSSPLACGATSATRWTPTSLVWGASSTRR
jgi:cell division septum initiation protein DivIVA